MCSDVVKHGSIHGSIHYSLAFNSVGKLTPF